MSGVSWLLIILILIRFDTTETFAINVLPSKEKCFYQVVTEGQKVFGSYSVAYGGQLDLNVQVTDPTNDLVYEQQLNRKKPDGSFEFVALKNGRYQLCLNNQKASVSTKRVSFSFHLGNEIKNAGLHISSYVLDNQYMYQYIYLYILYLEHFGSLERAISTLSIGIYSIQDHHYYMSIRDRYAKES